MKYSASSQVQGIWKVYRKKILRVMFTMVHHNNTKIFCFCWKKHQKLVQVRGLWRTVSNLILIRSRVCIYSMVTTATSRESDLLGTLSEPTICFMKKRDPWPTLQKIFHHRTKQSLDDKCDVNLRKTCTSYFTKLNRFDASFSCSRSRQRN